MSEGQIIPSSNRKSDRHRPDAVRIGDLILVSGLLPVDDAGRPVASDVAGQARYLFNRLEAILADLGATLQDVVKHNIYFAPLADETAMDRFMADLDAVRMPLFEAPGPTTTEIGVGLDVEGAHLMIDAWAMPGARRELLAPRDHWNWPMKTPFAHGWKVGDMIFIGGQRSLDGDGNLLGISDIEVQTDHAFRNLDTMLREAGGDRYSLMRQNTFFRFFGEGAAVTQYWEKMTNVRRRYMASPSAAGAGLRIAGFPDRRELIQVEGIGVLGEDKQRLQPDDHWDWSIPNSTFTQGWKIGGLAFIGGQISADNRGRAIDRGDIAAQTRNVFNFVRRTLSEGGLDESDVAKLYIYYYADRGQVAETRAIIEQIQREFYGEPGPAVTAVRVAGFAFEDLLIEIEALAVAR